MILVKRYDSIQLAHLYEHLFCTAINDFFDNHGLFSYLDYSVIGRTFHRGVVYIDIEFYTDQAKLLANKIPTLDIDLQFEMVVIGITQIAAEKEQPIGGLGYEAIKQSLSELHEQPWQDIDDVGLIDETNIRRKSGSLYIAEGKHTPSRRLNVSVSLSPDFATTRRDLLPLFNQLATLISNRLQIDITATCGYYSFELINKNTKKLVMLSSVFKVPRGGRVDINDIHDIAQSSISKLQDSMAYTRLVAELCRVSHSEHPDLIPNPIRIFEDTHILIGAAGWKKTATENNCDLLLQHMSIEVKYGHTKIQRPIGN